MVSVIIPTYGLPTFLKKSIRSVINQTFNDWELIIVDDNNPDTEERWQTEQLLREFTDNRIKYIQHPYNKNGAAARNTALRVAKGKYISFLDSDDEYLPARLEACVKIMNNADVNVAGVYTGCEFRRKGQSYRRYKKVKSGNFLVDTLACRFMFCTGSNIFVRKSVIEELNGFDESFLRHQDYEFLVRLFRTYTLIALPEILVIKNNENFNLPDIDKMKAVKKQYLNKFSDIIQKLDNNDRSFIFYANYISLAEQSLNRHNIKTAFAFYKLAINSRPMMMRDRIRKIFLIIKSYVTK